MMCRIYESLFRWRWWKRERDRERKQGKTIVASGAIGAFCEALGRAVFAAGMAWS